MIRSHDRLRSQKRGRRQVVVWIALACLACLVQPEARATEPAETSPDSSADPAGDEADGRDADQTDSSAPPSSDDDPSEPADAEPDSESSETGDAESEPGVEAGAADPATDSDESESPPGVADADDVAGAGDAAEAGDTAADSGLDDPLPVRPSEATRTRNARLSVRSFTPEETMAEMVARVESAGGWVQSSSNQNASLRVPMDELQTVMAALDEMGEVVDEEVTSQDVALELATLHARIRELESSRRRVKGMLELATNVEESLKIEKELNEVTKTLEENQGRMRFLQRRLEVAPLELHVSMKARPQVERPRKRQPFPFVERYGLAELLD